MKKLSLLFALFIFVTFNAQAQTVKLVGLNTLYGAATGTGLGAATMLINNSNEFGAMRVGFGAGTLAGLGLGIYDVTAEKGIIQGTFTDSDVSGQLIALDTFYGAGTGAVVGFAISLISNKDFLDGIKVGTGIGAWAGFGFGIVETFFLGNSGASGYGLGSLSNHQSVGGIVQVQDEAYSLGFLAPSQLNQINANGMITVNPTLTVAHFKVAL